MANKQAIIDKMIGTLGYSRDRAEFMLDQAIMAMQNGQALNWDWGKQQAYAPTMGSEVPIGNFMGFLGEIEFNKEVVDYAVESGQITPEQAAPIKDQFDNFLNSVGAMSSLQDDTLQTAMSTNDSALGNTNKSVVDAILGEAKAGNYDDMVAIASAMQNRANAAGVPIESVLHSKEIHALSPAPGTEKYRDMAEKALEQVMTQGPSHKGTYYATPNTTGNLPGNLQSVATPGAFHEFFSDPLGRSFRTTEGWRNPAQVAAFTPENPPVPTQRPGMEFAQNVAPSALPSPVPSASTHLGMDALAPRVVDTIPQGSINQNPAQSEIGKSFGFSFAPEQSFDGRIDQAFDAAQTPPSSYSGAFTGHMPSTSFAADMTSEFAGGQLAGGFGPQPSPATDGVFGLGFDSFSAPSAPQTPAALSYQPPDFSNDIAPPGYVIDSRVSNAFRDDIPSHSLGPAAPGSLTAVDMTSPQAGSQLAGLPDAELGVPGPVGAFGQGFDSGVWGGIDMPNAFAGLPAPQSSVTTNQAPASTPQAPPTAPQPDVTNISVDQHGNITYGQPQQQSGGLFGGLLGGFANQNNGFFGPSGLFGDPAGGFLGQGFGYFGGGGGTGPTGGGFNGWGGGWSPASWGGGFGWSQHGDPAQSDGYYD